MTPKKDCVWQVSPADVGNITSLIDFLEWARETLKLNEGAELRVAFHPENKVMELRVLQGADGPLRRVVIGSHLF